MLKNFVFRPVHLLGLLAGGVVESQMMEQRMGDVQRQLRVGVMPPTGSLPRSQLAVDDQVEDSGILGVRLLRQIETQTVRGPFVAQKLHVKPGNLGIVHNPDANYGV